MGSGGRTWVLTFVWRAHYLVSYLFSPVPFLNPTAVFPSTILFWKLPLVLIIPVWYLEQSQKLKRKLVCTVIWGWRNRRIRKALKWTESEAWDRSKHWVFPLRNRGLIQDPADSKSHRTRCFLDQLSWVAKSTAFRRQGRENQTQPSVTFREWLRVSPRKYPAPRQTMGFLNDHSPWELF